MATGSAVERESGGAADAGRPFWMLRGLDSLPGGAWARAAIAGGAVAAAHLGMLGLGESWRAYDVNLGFLIAAQGAYAAAALPRILRILQREAEALAPLLPGGIHAADRHLQRVRRPPGSWLWTTTALGIAAGFGLQEAATGRITRIAAGEATLADVWLLPLGAASWAFMLTAGLVVALAAIAFQRIGREIRVNLFDPDALRPFERLSLSLGLWTIGLFVLWASLAVLFGGLGGLAPTRGLVAVFATIGTCYVATAITVLVVPAWGVHRTLQHEKDAALERLRASLPSHRDPPAAPTWNLLHYELVVDAREWPFRGSAVVRFVIYLVLPLASMVAAALVERAIDSLFG